MTANETYMTELTETIGRFATPTIVIGDEVLLGFALNRARIESLLDEYDLRSGEQKEN